MQPFFRSVRCGGVCALHQAVLEPHGDLRDVKDKLDMDLAAHAHEGLSGRRRDHDFTERAECVSFSQLAA